MYTKYIKRDFVSHLIQNMERKAFAKINLALDVLGRRPDGYHDVRMIMQTVALCDRLILEAEPDLPGIRFACSDPGLPADERNLAVRAAKLLMEEAGVGQGLSIRLEKGIPEAAGLAGGSADAAETLKGVNRLFGLGFPAEELMRLGAKIGADVPYCILGGTALAEGIGEILTPLRDIPDCAVLLAKPPARVSTKEVYEALDAAEIAGHPDIDGMIGCIGNGDLRGTALRASNVLEPVTAAREPAIRILEEEMLKRGALCAKMSGSGPTVFGLFGDRADAEAAASLIEKEHPETAVYLTKPAGAGEVSGQD